MDASGCVRPGELVTHSTPAAVRSPLWRDLVGSVDRGGATVRQRRPGALRTRLLVETSQAVRISLVLALAQLAVEYEDPGVVAWTSQQWADKGRPPDVRFAAALSWLSATADPVPDPMLVGRPSLGVIMVAILLRRRILRPGPGFSAAADCPFWT
jgi:hypothetical protein